MAYEVAELDIEGAPADELTGYDRARAESFTGKIRAKLEKQGMTDIRFPAGDVDPDRQNVAWFIAKDEIESPVLIGDYRGYLVIMHAVYIGDVFAEVGGEYVNLGEPFALDAAGVANDGGIRGVRLGGVAYFTVRAWKGGNEFYNLADDMTRKPETFTEGIVQGIGLCMMTIDRHEEMYGDGRRVDEGAYAESDAPSADSEEPASVGLELDVEGVGMMDLLPGIVSDFSETAYDGDGGRVYAINPVGIAYGVCDAAKDMWGMSQSDAFAWVRDHHAEIIRMALPSEAAKHWEAADSVYDWESLSEWSTQVIAVAVADAGWTLCFSASAARGFTLIPNTGRLKALPEGKARSASGSEPTCLAQALAILSSGGEATPLIDGIIGMFARAGALRDDVLGFDAAERVCRSGVYVVPDGGEALDKLSDIGAGYSERPIEHLEVRLADGADKSVSYAQFGLLPAKSVELPEGLTDIGDGTFSRMWALSRLYVPETVRRIGKAAFVSGDSRRGKRLTVAFEGSEAEFGHFIDECGELAACINPMYGVARDAFRAMNGGEALSEADADDGHEPELEVIGVSGDELGAEWKAMVKPYEDSVRKRLEACGYGSVRFLQDISPKRDCAEWYCDSGGYDGVLSFEWQGLTFTAIAGGDHTYCIDGDYGDDMERLADYGIVDDAGLGMLEELSGNGTGLEGWCDFELSCRDSDGYDFSSRELDDCIGCTVSEVLDWVTDPGQMNWFVDEYRRDKESNAALMRESLAEDGGQNGGGLDIHPTGKEELEAALLSGFCQVAYDGADGELTIIDLPKAAAAFRDALSSGDPSDGEAECDALADSLCSIALPKRLLKHRGEVHAYLSEHLSADEEQKAAVAGSDDWLLMFQFLDGQRTYWDNYYDVETYPDHATDQDGVRWPIRGITDALALLVGDADRGIVRCVASLGKSRDAAGTAVSMVRGKADAIRILRSGTYTLPDDFSTSTLDALDVLGDEYLDVSPRGDVISLRFSSAMDEIRDTMFDGMPLRWHIESAELPDGLRSIGDYCFNSFHRLKKLFIPKTVAHLGRRLLPSDDTRFRCEVALEGEREDYQENEIRRLEGECTGCGAHMRFGVSREAFRSLGESLGGASPEPAEPKLDVEGTPEAELPPPDGMDELREFLDDVYGGDGGSQFIRIGSRLYDVQLWGGGGANGPAFLPLVYDFGGEGVTVARPQFPDNDSETAAAELVRAGVEPDGIDGMISDAVDSYNAQRLDSVPKCIDYICDMFQVREYAGYDDWKASKAGRGVV